MNVYHIVVNREINIIRKKMGIPKEYGNTWKKLQNTFVFVDTFFGFDVYFLIYISGFKAASISCEIDRSSFPGILPTFDVPARKVLQNAQKGDISRIWYNSILERESDQSYHRGFDYFY